MTHGGLKAGDEVLCYDYEEFREDGVYCYFSHFNNAGLVVAHRCDNGNETIWRYCTIRRHT